MVPSTQAFLEHIIDYAGLFPPAQLPLEQALANYLRYHKEENAWMLGRFICPAARLGEVMPFLKQVPGGRTFSLAVLGRGGQDAKELFDHVQTDLADITFLLEALKEKVIIETYEVPLPATLLHPPQANQLSGLVGSVANLIEIFDVPVQALFFECPVLGRGAVRTWVNVLRAYRQSSESQLRRHCQAIGWKLRCGGKEASAFPSAKDVALILASCCEAGIPWKATAGLHHPLPHFDADLQVLMHGFINIFGAGILAPTNQLSEEIIEEMLADEITEHFAFLESGFRWKKYQAFPEQIRAARKLFVTSFGSCSFDEPGEKLQKLGWI